MNAYFIVDPFEEWSRKCHCDQLCSWWDWCFVTAKTDDPRSKMYLLSRYDYQNLKPNYDSILYGFCCLCSASTMDYKSLYCQCFIGLLLPFKLSEWIVNRVQMSKISVQDMVLVCFSLKYCSIIGSDCRLHFHWTWA